VLNGLGSSDGPSSRGRTELESKKGKLADETGQRRATDPYVVNILGKSVPRKKVRQWKKEKVAKGKSETVTV
jgi:hypothetical protein